jgi:hypothetical protein
MVQDSLVGENRSMVIPSQFYEPFINYGHVRVFEVCYSKKDKTYHPNE